MTAEDRAAYMALADEFYHTDAVLHAIPATYYEAIFDEAIRHGPYVDGYLFEQDGQLAGYAIVTRSFSTEAGGPVLWIEEVYIRPAFQGHGLGKAFFAFLEATYPPAVRRFRLEVEPDNARAIALYQRLGFEDLPYKQMIRDFSAQ
nr:GNAT family N-acetyltransferase [bacterium]